MAFRGTKIVPIFRRLLSVRRPTNCASAGKCSHRHFSSRRGLVPEWFSAKEIVENRMRQIDREMSRVFDELQQVSSFFPRLFDTSPAGSSRTRNIPVIRADDAGGRVYRIDVDLQGLEPEDIQITLKDDILTIRGEKKVVKDDGSHHHREYSYQYTVPSEVDPDTVRSFFEKGVLKIEAPLPKLEETSQSVAKEIPVKVEGKKQ